MSGSERNIARMPSVNAVAVSRAREISLAMPNSNLLLTSLSRADAALLQPHLKTVFFQQQQILFEPGQSIAQALLGHRHEP
jgi:hypothetical protein